MKLPKLNDISVSKDIVEEFKGYNHNLRTTTGEWYNMHNMTVDYYPAASPRQCRALQKTIKELKSENLTVKNKCLGMVYSDGHLISLQETSSGSACFVNDGELVGTYNADVVKKFLPTDSGRDTVDGRKRSIVRNGSYVIVMPDGIVYETNKSNGSPVKAIEMKKSFLPDTADETQQAQDIKGLRYYTVRTYNNSEFIYSPIKLYDEYITGYKIGENGVQEYLESSAMWVDVKTNVLILSDDPSAFDDFNIGDNISISITDSQIPYDSSLEDNEQDLAVNGLLEWDEKTDDWKVQERVIIDKGVTKKHSRFHLEKALRSYIVVDGYVYQKYKKYWDGMELAEFWFGDYTNSLPEGNNIGGLSNKYTLNATATVNIERRKPDVAFACESQNRIWCCSKDGHEIYASALGNPYSYYNYSGLSTDSYAVNVGTDGEFTGCCNYLGYPLFFKENALHIIYGNYPAQYQVTTHTEFNGVEKGSEKSLAIVNNILYYKSAIGIVAYDGSNTILVSEALGKEKYKNAVAGTYKNKYYVSMENSRGARELFCFDTYKNMWCREDETDVWQIININNELIYCDGNMVYSINDGKLDISAEYKKENKVEWFCETGTYGYSYPNNKYLSRFQIRMQLAEGSCASFYIQYDSDGVWHRKGEMHGKGIRTYLIPIVPMRCDHMKIKIEGSGDAKIFSIAKLLEEGGDQ